MSRITAVRVGTLCAAMVLSVACAQALAQNYPSKAVRVVVGFPAGGPADTMARIIAKKLAELAGQTFIIENRPGANGFLAGEFVDSKPLVDPDRDLALVTQAVSVPQIFVVHPSLPVRNLQELQQFAKQRPGQLNASVIGLGGLIHLGMELFKNSAGITMTNVVWHRGGRSRQQCGRL